MEQDLAGVIEDNRELVSIFMDPHILNEVRFLLIKDEFKGRKNSDCRGN